MRRAVELREAAVVVIPLAPEVEGCPRPWVGGSSPPGPATALHPFKFSGFLGKSEQFGLRLIIMISSDRLASMTLQPKLDAAPFIPRIEDPAPFPDSERIIYTKNPLETVICQFRFPAILKVSSEPPVDFQEALRKDFPLFREIPPLNVPGTGWPSELAAIVSKLMPLPSSKGYELTSENSAWQITLTQDSLALQCKSYRRWEEFRDILQKALGLLEKIYQPSFYTRIGLRYSDVIARHKLGLKDVPWSDLLSKDLAGEFHSQIAGSVEGAWHQLSLRLQGDVAKVTLQHGLSDKDGQVCYVIDTDFYAAERIGVKDADRILAYFNRQAGRVFRWCIAEKLHRAMEPEPVK